MNVCVCVFTIYIYIYIYIDDVLTDALMHPFIYLLDNIIYWADRFIDYKQKANTIAKIADVGKKKNTQHTEHKTHTESTVIN